MVAQSVHLRGIILKREASGEQFYRLNVLSKESGNTLVMMRRPKKNIRSGSTPDLFDKIEAVLDKKGEGGFGFIKEVNILSRRRGLAKSFIALELACEWANILIKNVPRDMEIDAVYQLTERGLDAWEKRSQPEAVFFKCLFVYARNEGYPVKHDWFEQLTHQNRTSVATILNTPISELNMKPEEVRKWNDALKHYIQHHTDILL